MGSMKYSYGCGILIHIFFGPLGPNSTIRHMPTNIAYNPKCPDPIVKEAQIGTNSPPLNLGILGTIQLTSPFRSEINTLIYLNVKIIH